MDDSNDSWATSPFRTGIFTVRTPLESGCPGDREPPAPRSGEWVTVLGRASELRQRPSRSLGRERAALARFGHPGALEPRVGRAPMGAAGSRVDPTVWMTVPARRRVPGTGVRIVPEPPPEPTRCSTIDGLPVLAVARTIADLALGAGRAQAHRGRAGGHAAEAVSSARRPTVAAGLAGRPDRPCWPARSTRPIRRSSRSCQRSSPGCWPAGARCLVPAIPTALADSRPLDLRLRGSLGQDRRSRSTACALPLVGSNRSPATRRATGAARHRLGAAATGPEASSPTGRERCTDVRRQRQARQPRPPAMITVSVTRAGERR